MRELERIRGALADCAERGEAALLVTVLEIAGSVYRGEGARMVVRANGGTVGAVSGGCLEADIVVRAESVLASGTAEVVEYDSRVASDPMLGLGLGCQGAVTVLLEPLSGVRLTNLVSLFGRLLARTTPAELLTRVEASRAGAIGDRLLLDDRGAPVEGDRSLLDLASSVSRERILPARRLLICGAGNDAIPLAKLATELGLRVTVVDHRASLATSTRFSTAFAVFSMNVIDNTELLLREAAVESGSFAVVMAHSAAHDRAYLHALLRGNVEYIGVLGPRRRTLELLGDAHAPDDRIPPNVYAPVGLDLGAETPEEVALSIVAELIATANERAGAPLRERKGPIHPGRAPSEVTAR
ncbi:MAG: XdhC family protein [Gemmatimonadaceae bacterium]|nr:XdhC family protein [Gemmatimonadaceae bacterium]